MAAGGHFGWPKITFDRISRHFRSIRNFYFFEYEFRLHFSAFSDKYSIFILFLFCSHCRRPFWMTEITFDPISRHFRSIRNFYLFWFFPQNGCRRPFGWPKITFDRISAISDQYATFVFTKWLPAGILDDRKSLLIAFLPFQINTQLLFSAAILDNRKSLLIASPAISDQYATFIFFTKWLTAAILDDRKSLSKHFSLFQINTQLFFNFVFKMAASGQ